MRRTFFVIYLIFLAIALCDYVIRLPCMGCFDLFQFGKVFLYSSVTSLIVASFVFLVGDLFWVICMPLFVWGVACSVMEWVFCTYLTNRGVVGEHLMVTIVTLNWGKVYSFFFHTLPVWQLVSLIALAIIASATVMWMVSRFIGSPTLKSISASAVIIAVMSSFMAKGIECDHLMKALMDHGYMNALGGTSMYCELAEGGEPLPDGYARTSETNLLAVIVIGESSTRRDWSLYGYSRRTTPNLDAISSELVVFSNVTATICFTPYALRDIFTHRYDDRVVSLPALAVCAGYDGTMLSGQSRYGYYEGAGELLFSSMRRQYLCDLVRSGEQYFDGDLIPLFKDELCRPTNGNRIVFVHLVGSHTPWRLRYPIGFGDFPIDFNDAETDRLAPPWRKSVNEYDNSIQYGDMVVSSLQKLSAHHSGPVVFAFISDHGESPRTYGRDLTHSDTHEIPFFIWMSDDYRRCHTEVVRRLEESRNRPIDSVDLFPVWMDLLGISRQ